MAAVEVIGACKKCENPSPDCPWYRHHIQTITLPDPDDRHVVAAGIARAASAILTWNVGDFPLAELKTHNLRHQTPDSFLVDLYEKTPDLLVSSLANARRNLGRTRVRRRFHR